MERIRVKTPAKINLTLKVEEKRPDGFHSIKSIMAAINLFDYINIELKRGSNLKINISSNSDEIPHNSANIAYKAAEEFLKACPADIFRGEINIYIEKNIPVCAGLAGGSTNACGVVFALNKLFNYPLLPDKIDMLLSKLGSDLNFCYKGGTKLCKGRGEILEPFEFSDIPITLIKPKNLKVSAKEAYQRFDEMSENPDFPNDLEAALLPCYNEIKYLHDLGFQMSGSGPTFFAKKQYLEPSIKEKLGDDYLIIENLKTVEYGAIEVD